MSSPLATRRPGRVATTPPAGRMLRLPGRAQPAPFPAGLDRLSFHVISFEGPDEYARAGGIASRTTGLTRALADTGFETHHWFLGDPDLPGHEPQGQLTLHRWCQWISRHHALGVYDGEEGKRRDLSASLPPFLLRELVRALERQDTAAVIIAEEWQTVDVVLHLDGLLRAAGLRDRVKVLWNANNTFGFDRVDWSRLNQAATITTVSRFMRFQMWELGVDPVVLPNGLPPDVFSAPSRRMVQDFRRRLAGRTVLAKVARWDPDKRWRLAIEIAGALKREGARPLLVARGGIEAHGAEVLSMARSAGLHVAERHLAGTNEEALLKALDGLQQVDVVNLKSPLRPEASRLLFRASDAVLANSGQEPFGLVGLEAMAVGSLVCTGGTGEDYAVPGWNALVLQSMDPAEFLGLFRLLQRDPKEQQALRRRGRATAFQYAWSHIVRRTYLPRLGLG